MAGDGGSTNRSASRADLVSTYWLHHWFGVEAGNDAARAADLFWAWQEVDGRMSSDRADVAVDLLIDLANAADGDEGRLAYLGAGPVEDLLVRRAEEVVSHIEDAATSHEAFRLALTCAWYDDSVAPEIAQRLRRFGEPF